MTNIELDPYARCLDETRRKANYERRPYYVVRDGENLKAIAADSFGGHAPLLTLMQAVYPEHWRYLPGVWRHKP